MARLVGSNPHDRVRWGPQMRSAQRRVARAVRAGGQEVIELGFEELAPLKKGEALVRVEAAGLNHAETLIRSGNLRGSLAVPVSNWARGRRGRRADPLGGPNLAF